MRERGAHPDGATYETNWQSDWQREAHDEILHHDPVYQACRATDFVSTSNGKNRKRRHSPREVSLLTLRDGKGTTYMIEDDSLRRVSGGIPGDALAAEILGAEEDDPTVEKLIARARQNATR